MHSQFALSKIYIQQHSDVALLTLCAENMLRC